MFGHYCDVWIIIRTFLLLISDTGRLWVTELFV